MELKDLDLLEDRVGRALSLIAGLREEKGKLEERMKKLKAENSALKKTKEEARKRIGSLLKKLSFLSG